MRFINVLSAEILKLKRTFAVWLIVIAPVTVIFTRFLEWIRFGEHRIPESMDIWIYFSKSILTIWSMLMLPFFIVLEMALLNNLEHTENNWKQLFAHPVPRQMVYFSKLIVGIFLIAGGMIMLFILIPVAGYIIGAINSNIHFPGSVPYQEISYLILNTFFPSLLIITIHHWISTRYKEFTLSTGIGIVTIFMGLVATSSSFGKYFPWSLPTAAVFGHGERLFTAYLISIVGAIILAILGSYNIKSRDIL